MALAGLTIGPAFAQGTAEQREACAPDAVRLCPDTIPDVPRTKACMARHVTELSPRCRTVFLGATRGPAVAGESRRSRRIARAAPPAAESTAPDDDIGLGAPSIDVPTVDVPTVDVPSVDLPDAGPSRAQTARDARRARVVVNRLCRDSLLDASTCGFTNRMIDLAE